MSVHRPSHPAPAEGTGRPSPAVFPLRMVDGRTVPGRPRGLSGGVLRWELDGPVPGTVALSVDEVEPLSLHDALDRATDPGDGDALLRLAAVTAGRGLFDLALADLSRAGRADPALRARVRAARSRVLSLAAGRRLEEARRLAAGGRLAHARAALEDVLRVRPSGAAGWAARALLAALAG